MAVKILTKDQVEAAIKKGTLKKVDSSKKSSNEAKILWTESGTWTSIALNLRGTIKKQTEDLVKTLNGLHTSSELELLPYKNTFGKLGSIGGGLFKLAAGFSLTSWFDYMTYAMTEFGKYVTEKLENKNYTPTESDKLEIQALAKKVTKMVENYVDHSIFTKIAPIVLKDIEGKSFLERMGADIPDIPKTERLIATLCDCVNYGTFNFGDSWMKHILKLAK